MRARRRLALTAWAVTLLGAGLAGATPVAAAVGDVSGTVSVSGVDHRPAVPTGLTVKVAVDQQPGETEPTLLRRLQLTLPAGLELGAQGGSGPGGLPFCSTAAFAVGAAGPATCPPATAIGATRVVVPGDAGPRTGELFLGPPASPGLLPQLFLEAAVGGSAAPLAARIKLVGGLSDDPSGRLIASFDEIPNVHFGELQLTFSPGDHALLSTPDSCDAYAVLASLTAAATGAGFSAAAPFSIDQECARPTFSPALGLALATDQVTAGGKPLITVAREDRTPLLGTTRVSLPSGLLASFGSVAECGLSGDAAGGCGSASRIGGVTVVAGAGAAPATWEGSIFLTGIEAGAVAGAELVVPVRMGSLELGNLVVPVRLDLRPTDAGLDLQFTLPTRFRGLALRVRSVALNLDRDGFVQNPSSCGPVGYSASFTSPTGATASQGAQVGLSGCQALGFLPTLSAALTGETQPLGHPNVSVALSARPGDSNLAGATVTLPAGIGADLANLRDTCSVAAFQSVTCSANQRVGTAIARVALSNDPVPGDVYLVSVPGQTLPGLGLSFNGRYAQRVLSRVFINGEGRLVTQFGAIPDLPLRRLDMDIFGGRRGPLQVSKAPCRPGALWDAAFTGHGGQASSHTIPSPCPLRDAKRAAVSISSKYGLVLRLSDLGGRNLQTAKLTLPKGFAFIRSRAGNRRYQRATLLGGKSTIKVTNRSVQLTARSNGVTSATLRLNPGTIRRTVKLRNPAGLGVPVTVRLRLGFTDGTVQRQKIRIRAK